MAVRPLSDALRKKAKEEINEDPKEVAAALAVLRDWLDLQPHLRNVKLSDQWLIAFLRGSKFNIKKAQDKFETYYSLRTITPEFAANRDPLDPSIQEILRIGFCLPLKKCSEDDSPRCCLIRAAAFNGSKHSLADLIKVALMIVEILMIEDDNFTISGEEVIADVNDLSFGIITQWTPTLAKKVITCAEKALSVRFKSLHLVNAGRGLKMAIEIFKFFLGSKMKTRIHVHKKDFGKVHQVFDKSILPVEYGGTDGNVQGLIDHWKKKVESYRDWFLQQDAVRDEGSKTTDSENVTNMLGVVNCFNKLDID